MDAKKRPKSKGDLGRKEKAATLTDRQEKFCRALVENNYQKRKAAIEAGYAEKSAHVTASETLKNPKILERIRALQEQQAKELFLSESRVMVELMGLYEAAKKAGKLFDALKTLELIGKQLGMFMERAQKAEGAPEDDGFLEALEGGAATAWADGDDGNDATKQKGEQNENTKEH
jgi:hypothetical protein